MDRAASELEAQFPARATVGSHDRRLAAERCAASALKRGTDVTGAAIGLVLLSPLFLAISVLIRLENRGPVLFRQQRSGIGGEKFTILKFRTMRVTPGDAVFRQVSSRNDERITRLGRFLRRSNFDELPQLVNVLKGEMSLVGPRPHPLALDASFEDLVPGYSARRLVRPGLTGWAQVNGRRGPTRTRAQMAARVADDLHYIDNWSHAMDLQILCKTALSRRSYTNAF